MNYLNKYSPTTVEICELLRRLTSVKALWTWNNMYQELYDKAKAIIKKDTCLKFYNEMEPVYLETGASDIDVGARLLQVRDGMSYPRDEASDNLVHHLQGRACPVQKPDIAT